MFHSLPIYIGKIRVVLTVFEVPEHFPVLARYVSFGRLLQLLLRVGGVGKPEEYDEVL
jgi:hypothetical protein